MPTVACYSQLSTHTLYQIYEERGLVDPPLVHEELIELLLLHDVRYLAAPSPLLALPPEMRNRIYQMAFEDDGRAYRLVFDGQKETRIWTNSSDIVDRLHPLLFVNKQIRKEASSIWYERDYRLGRIFDPGTFQHCVKWLSSIGVRDIRHLRRVTFTGRMRKDKHEWRQHWTDFSIDLAADTAAKTVQYRRWDGETRIRDEDKCYQNALHATIAEVHEWEAVHEKRLDAEGWEAFLTGVRDLDQSFDDGTFWKKNKKKKKV
ncbi:hypothetical protein LTR15_006546 [Elasticomyces elasticus]|nr:hypothetical protein LTR15_006546 [Elasticomyces elasticus]